MDRAGFVRGVYEAMPEDIRAALRHDETVAALVGLLKPLLTEDFSILLAGPEGMGLEETHQGADGFIAGWRDWTDPYDRYIFELQQIFESGDIVLAEGKQKAVPKGSTGEILTDGIALWRFRGDQVERIEFHLDRERAYRLAGVE